MMLLLGGGKCFFFHFGGSFVLFFGASFSYHIGLGLRCTHVLGWELTLCELIWHFGVTNERIKTFETEEKRTTVKYIIILLSFDKYCNSVVYSSSIYSFIVLEWLKTSEQDLDKRQMDDAHASRCAVQVAMTKASSLNTKRRRHSTSRKPRLHFL